MKKKDIFDAFERLDPKFVEEAAPNIYKKARKPFAFRLAVIAACIALLTMGVVLGALLLNREDAGQKADTTDGIKDYQDGRYDGEQQSGVPDEIPDRIKEYQDSRYFEIIRSLDAYFEELKNRPADDIPMEDNGSENIQVTDNQTRGIEEADKIKRTNTHIFYMDGQYLRAFTIDGENSREVGSYKVSSSTQNEFFLTEDGKTVIVISDMHSIVSFQPGASTSVSYVDVLALDVSDPADIKEKTLLSIKGGCLSARLVEGKLLIFIRYRAQEELVRFSDPLTFLPSIDRGNGYELLPDNEIICNEKITNSVYTVALMLDAENLALEKNIALLSYWNEPYVSENKIFFSGIEGNGATHTNILAVDYTGEDFDVLGSATVRGTLKDQWSMDEKDGVLRVVTSTKTSADLYCISLESFEELASVKDFAPEGESVQSVRFDGDNAYVCTALRSMYEILDPVFFFDLSDVDNISYKDTGTIDGRSTSLVDFGGGYLVGIGSLPNDYGNPLILKIEVYKETEQGVAAVCQYVLSDVGFATEYKAYYIDRQNQLLGFGYMISPDPTSEEIDFMYALIRFDAESERFVELLNVELGSAYNESKRGVYIDGYMYMFGENDFKVVAVDVDNIDAEHPNATESTDGQS